MIVSRAAILQTGIEIVLRVQPIDPRDLLRGDYVILDYNISSIPTELFEDRLADPGFSRGDVVFVRLRSGDDGIWQPVAARIGEKPSAPAGEGEVDLRGVAASAWYPDMGTLRVTYGLERFYVPEGEGREIERDMAVRPFRMAVAVSSGGVGQIKAFYDGETMLYAEPLY